MNELRGLPRVDDVAASESLEAFPPAVRTRAARAAVGEARERAKAGLAIGAEKIEASALKLANEQSQNSLAPAINMSGVILHTGLGRARLAKSVADHVAKVANSHATVEFDLEEGGRGDRQAHVRDLLCELTGAEDAHVVNNAAAGVLLSLTALCAGGEVLLSRGQMVEIGGSFRMPDIVRQSGCTLVEVGCTNKTRLSDYEEAIGEATKAILRCHPSNFKIVGFTEEPSLESLAELSRGRSTLLIDDQGSGCLLDLARFGLSSEPTLPGSIRGAADVAIASGDKLLGGPQAGIIVGKASLIGAIRKHPLARAVRIDKLTLAALEATLRLYTTGREEELPVVRYLAKPLTEIRKTALRLANAYKGEAIVEEGFTEIGGGSAPGSELPTWRVGLSSKSPEALAKRLRTGNPPVIGKIERDRVWLDPRTAEPDEVRTVARILGGLD